MRQRVKGLLLLLISVSFLLAAFFPITFAQDEYLPPDNSDIDEVAQMLDRVEYYAKECERYRCPKLECRAARDLFLGLSALKQNSQLYAFWISQMPQFDTSPRVRTRYDKASALFYRLKALLNRSGNDERGKGSLSNCLTKLKSACGDLTEPPEENPYLEFYPLLQVEFPSGTEPGKGTAKFPDFWLAGIRGFLALILGDRVLLSTFPVPERVETWIETEKSSFTPGGEIHVSYSVAPCCTSLLRLNLVKAGLASGFPGEMEDNKQTWLTRVRGSDSLSIVAPRAEGDYELRLYNSDSGDVVAFSEFSIHLSVPQLVLVGRWRTNDGLEVLINRDGDRFVGNITALGKISETRKYWKFRLGGLLWSIVPEGATNDGRAIYTFYCTPDLPVDIETALHSAEITMESDDSFVVPVTSCKISPDQKEGFIRLWRVHREPKADPETKPSENPKNR